MERTEKRLEIIEDLLESNLESDIKEFIRDERPEDIAEYFRELDRENKLKLFLLLPRDKAVGVLESLDDASLKDIVSSLDNEELYKYLSLAPIEDSVDILSEISDERLKEILALFKREKRQDIIELLSYPEDSAGGIMTKEYIALPPDMSVKEALIQIKKSRARDNALNKIYVIDKDEHLIGYVRLPDIVKAEASKRLGDIVKRDVISIDPYMDQEEVANIVSKYDVYSLPVVDTENRLIGVIYMDDIIDIVNEEATEDILKMAGTSEDEILAKSSTRAALIRLPWLITSFLGSIMSGMIISGYELTLKRIIALASFMPVITAMGGNVGVQSAAIVIRGLSTGYIDVGDVIRVLFKEMKVGFIIGLVVGTFVGIIADLWKGNGYIGFVIFVSMVAAMTVAATVGTIMPIILKRFNIDPAIATGPFVTTLNDITGFIIYFNVANLLLG